MLQGFKTWNALGKGDPIIHKVLSLLHPGWPADDLEVGEYFHLKLGINSCILIQFVLN